AALNIRSTLLNVETEQSPLLNVVIGGLLGGNLNVAVVGWRGLVDTDVKLLYYLDAFAIYLDFTVEDYNRLIQTEATAGQLLQAVVTALELQRGTIPGATLDAAITALGAIKDEIKIPSIKKLTVGEILNVQSGTLAAGLETNLQ